MVAVRLHGLANPEHRCSAWDGTSREHARAECEERWLVGHRVVPLVLWVSGSIIWPVIWLLVLGFLFIRMLVRVGSVSF